MEQYFEANRELWDQWTGVHVPSAFYDVAGFVAGRSTLNAIELELLGDVTGKRLLHLQCHFGMDTLSLARMGAQATGLDFSEQAIDHARQLAIQTGLNANFIHSNLYDMPDSCNGQFDIVYTSYGTIGWLPDLHKWAATISRALKPGGRLVFVEFHPFMWIWDGPYQNIVYHYFNRAVIEETTQGSYADRTADIALPSFSWNHSLSEVLGALLQAGLSINSFREYDYSPYNCFPDMVTDGQGRYYLPQWGDKVPMVYSLIAEKG